MSEKKKVREVEMLGALAAGVALGFVSAFTLLSYFWEWGVIKGAKWWDVMTAFGTVGAVIVALLVPVWQYWKRQQEIAVSRWLASESLIDDLLSILSECASLGNHIVKVKSHGYRFDLKQDYLPVLEGINSRIRSLRKTAAENYERRFLDQLGYTLSALQSYADLDFSSAYERVSFAESGMGSLFERLGILGDRVFQAKRYLSEKLEAVGVDRSMRELDGLSYDPLILSEEFHHQIDSSVRSFRAESL